MMTKTQINKLIKMMNDLDYPFEAPLKESFIESIIQIEFNSNSTNCLEKLCNEVSILFKNQPDYLTFLRAMDGFEVNGLRLFSLSIPEPSVKNLFAVNEFYRNNDDLYDMDPAGGWRWHGVNLIPAIIAAYRSAFDRFIDR